MKTILGLLALSLVTGCLDEEELLLEEETSEVTLSAPTYENAPLCDLPNAAAPASQLRVQTGSATYTNWSVPALGVGQYFLFDVAYNPPYGEYWRTVKADGANLVRETHETDNTSGWGCIR